MIENKYYHDDEDHLTYAGFTVAKNGTDRVLIGICLNGQGAFVSISRESARLLAGDLLSHLSEARVAHEQQENSIRDQV